jgi:RNA polymerase sigma-B factor
MTGAGVASETDRRSLLREYRENGDVAARDRLVEDFTPLVNSLARRYAGRGEQLEDLQQVAALGLVKAIDRFDLDRDVELVTYIFPTVVGELKRHFRDRVWAVTVPRRLKELYQLVSRLIEELSAENGRSPRIADLAQAAGVTEEEVVEALEAGPAYTARSLTALHQGQAGGQDGDVELVDLLEDEERGYEAAENRDLLAAGLQALDERERRIIQLRFVDGLTQSEIAADIGVSQMHVSRLLRRALERLQREVEKP